MRDSKYLLPDNQETIRATEILAKEGFVVMPYMYPDLNVARDLVNAGAASIILFIITAILGIIVFRMNRDADEARKKKERKELVKAYKREQKLAKMGGVD